MTFTTSLEHRYFEDYLPGAVHEFGGIAVDEAEMIAFARRFDPQPFHTNPEAGRESVFGGPDCKRLVHGESDDAALC